MREDEKQFLNLVYNNCTPFSKNLTVREFINSEECPVHYKRAWYLLGKWLKKGWYNYGVTIDLGWLTEEGKKIAENET